MRTVGVIAEYDPFHQGHAYHLAEAKRRAEADCAVVVMSSCFTQRGKRRWYRRLPGRKWRCWAARTR